LRFKKKVIFPFTGDSFGGSHKSSISLIKNLNSLYFEPIVFLHKNEKLTKFLNEENIKWIHNKDAKKFFEGDIRLNFFLIFSLLFRYIKILKKLDVDIVHTNDLRMHLTWFLPCRILKIKHVWHQRSAGGKQMNLAIFSSAIITISEFCKKTFPKYIQNKTYIVNNPIDITNDFYPLENRSSKYFTICVVANINAQKRIDTAINIISSLNDSTNYYFKLKVFGEKREPTFSSIEQLIIEKNVINEVEFMGVKSPIEPWILKCDILLATAENEGLGRSVLEAMFLGIPVVASNSGGHTEIIINNLTGLLVDLEDVNGYKNAIIELITNINLKNKIIKNAKDFALKNYNVESHVIDIVDIYNQILNGK
jgi:glycosyltransferase involved in cell wall biosynthesis